MRCTCLWAFFLRGKSSLEAEEFRDIPRVLFWGGEGGLMVMQQSWNAVQCPVLYFSSSVSKKSRRLQAQANLLEN